LTFFGLSFSLKLKKLQDSGCDNHGRSSWRGLPRREAPDQGLLFSFRRFDLQVLFGTQNADLLVCVVC
jgi:hypothetical protein